MLDVGCWTLADVWSGRGKGEGSLEQLEELEQLERRQGAS